MDRCCIEAAKLVSDYKDQFKFEEMPIRCMRCGYKLEVYYCEERVYAVRCKECKSVTLVYAARKLDAARKVGNYQKTK